MLVALGSVKGSPGVTTAALALAQVWPARRPVVVVEADPSGGDLRAWFSLASGPGLVSLAAASTRDVAGRASRHVQRLPGGVAVVAAPAGAGAARSALVRLASDDVARLRRMAAGRVAVIVDLGRLEPVGASAAVVRAAEALVVVSHATDAALMHLAGWVREEARSTQRVGLELVGPGYGRREVASALGVPVLGRIPADRRGAVRVGLSPRRGLPRSRLLRATTGVAERLAALTGQGVVTSGGRGAVGRGRLRRREVGARG